MIDVSPVDLSKLTDHEDLQDLVIQYGHRDCTDLAAYLCDTYNLSPMWVVGKKTGVPVHVFVQFGLMALDAYGISSLATVLERYGHLITDSVGEPPTFEMEDRAGFLQKYRCSPDALAAVQGNFQIMSGHLGLTHDDLVREGERQLKQNVLGMKRFRFV